MATALADTPLSSEQERKMTPDARNAFDYTCKYYLNISGEEFLRKYDLGVYAGSSDCKVQRVIAMLPFAR